MKLHDQQHALHQRVARSRAERHAGLRRLADRCAVDHHDVQAFHRLRPADMALDKMGGQMRGRGAARAGQPVAVDDEDLVGDRCQAVEGLEEVVVMEPAHTAPVAVHQPGAVQHERPGAQAHQRDVMTRCKTQEVVDAGIARGMIGEQAADHDDVVEAPWIAEPLLRLDRDPAAGGNRGQVGRDDGPVAQDRAAAVAFVGREPEHVDEIGEGAQRETLHQNETYR
jgi:hypothetical protein